MSFSSCSVHLSRKKAPQKTSSPLSKTTSASDVQAWRTRLGKVVLVDSAHDFVLVDIGTSPAPEPGTKLRSYADTVISGELNVSAQQRRPYLIADILAGRPKIGDMVVAMPVNRSKSTSTSQPASPFPKRNVSPFQSNEESEGHAGEVPSIVPSIIPSQNAPQTRIPAGPRFQELEGSASDAIIPGLPVFRKK